MRCFGVGAAATADTRGAATEHALNHPAQAQMHANFPADAHKFRTPRWLCASLVVTGIFVSIAREAAASRLGGASAACSNGGRARS